MTNRHDLLPAPLNAAAVRSYINFDGADHIDLDGSTQARLQSKGVAAIWHLLQTRGYAYLADEVGMGKTRQALGVIATQFLSEPDSHVVIVCPGKTLQQQWAREWETFIRTCYKSKDDRLVSTVDGRPLHRPQRYERLSDFAKSLLLNERRIHLLRYSSFRRPIWFGGKSKDDTPDHIRAQYEQSLHEIGIDTMDDHERRIVHDAGRQPRPQDWREALTAALNEAYAQRIGKLLKHRNINLVTLDEAQYLRHTDNRQNTNLAHVLRGHVQKWHFLSATPLHSGSGDIKSLDTYLCRLPDGHNHAQACGNCPHATAGSCTQATYRMRDTDGRRRADVVTLLKEFMVRRPRAFIDGDDKAHGKVHYRSYRRVTTSAAGDPFLALTMALVQKHLVHILDGQSNRFRQGECSSFESLSASVKRLHVDKDGNEQLQREFDHQDSTGGKPPEETPDRGLINNLNASFFNAMLPGVKRSDPPDPQYNLPHAKLSQVCEALAADSLRDGTLHKTLVFVRRIDTVNEMVLDLMSRFQRQLDERLAVWRALLAAQGSTQVWHPGEFWTRPVRSGPPPQEIDYGAAADAGRDDDESELNDRAQGLPYFAALRRKKVGAAGLPVKLHSFQAGLLAAPNRSTPLDGFLQDRIAHPEAGIAPAVWERADAQWRQLLAVLTLDEPLPDWLTTAAATDEARWRSATLKRCLLQSLRYSDFLVDLYILHNYRGSVPGAPDDAALADKLLALLRLADGERLPPPLRIYLHNWKLRLRRWIDHFDLIVDKCLRKDAANWQAIYHNVDPEFRRMAPVVGRSGMLPNQNAVTQFNFPTYPNILVCTDVLKEGVDMHLFCDDIVHYGVAWTSGDLEQRIGRVDRFGSQISRRLARHTAASAAPMPRLSVEFPYLEGTLDRYQVERVMIAKVKSDLRMDLGKQESEIGHITIGNLDDPREADGDATEQAREQYPASIAPLLDGAIGQHGAFDTGARTAIDGQVHAPELDAMIISRQQQGPHPLLRKSTGKRARDTLIHLEYLLPCEAPAKPAPADLQQDMAFAVSTFPEPTRFRYQPRWNTLAQDISISNPFLHHIERNQTVLLERLQDYYLLRTPIARLGDDGSAARWHDIIAEENRRRRWGYLVVEHDIVWFVCLTLSAGGAWLDRLGARLAKIGDRLQHLYTRGADRNDWPYRATTSITDIAAAHTFFFQGRTDQFMSNNFTDLQAHGRLLAGVQQWLGDAFDSVMSALYGGDVPAEARDLSTLPIRMLPDGVLHIGTAGAERFDIEVYLQLHAAQDDNGTVSGPRMLWQLVTSLATKGPKPDLQGYDWEDLPYEGERVWHSGPEREAAVCFTEYDGRRYATFYHHPAKWDSERKRLQSFWCDVLERMRTTNFQQKYISDSFFAALGHTK
ncbi:hypothetical protein FHW58_001472 [Duganella sp. 1224]|uniref:DEAD/DEAH box helicase n=1 Tax=Duganella sp. 1224 TaxID=2587052 RepID=UPI0015C9E997|nr:SNF2-related protein [Duganella sp. 1224]NYE60320.1 hypothetical protein [Duganella sp. 1224]